ncbi:MAG TPA: MraY family glycosyltransferase [Blastocatellia bacterium]|nr:MraY family glycosyltransferase [Blastocatellia bacterium]
MLSFLLAFASAFLLTILLTPLAKWKAAWLDAFDHPNEPRRVHQTPMPRLGGVAIFTAFALGWAVLVWFDPSFFSTGILLLAATPIFLLGVVDDLRGVGERLKLIVPTGCAVLLFTSGWRITSLSLLPEIAFSLPLWLDFVLTVLWVVGMTNAFNLIDGLDGLAVGIAALALAALLVCALLLGQQEAALLTVLLLGALLGFLPYNFYPAKIFLGDSGSLWIGFVIAALLLRGTANEAGLMALTAPTILGLPLLEAVVTLLRRWIAGHPLLPGDRGHFHHKLLELGCSQPQAVLRLYAVGLVFAASGVILLMAGTPLTIGMLLLLGLGIVWGVRALPYSEFRNRTRRSEPL